MTDFSFPQKPNNWKDLPLYEKISFTMNKFNKNFSPYVDKLEAKKIVKTICGDSIEVPQVIKILKGPNDIEKEDLNPGHLIKGAHGCDFNINIKQDNNIDEIKKKIHSFNRVFSDVREKQYSYLKPRFFIEKKIQDKIYGETGNAVCYLLRCIHGVPHTFSIRLKHKKQISNYLFNNDKSLIEIPKLDGETPSEVGINKIGQKNIERMYDLAGKLSNDFEFVRIDLYLGKDDKIYFSEFTFSPAAGRRRFPMPLEMKLGELWI